MTIWCRSPIPEFADHLAAGLAAGGGKPGSSLEDMKAQALDRFGVSYPSAIRCMACRWCFPRIWRMHSAAR